ncbi:regulatory signaling modulator protein AmpE [Neiella marina]|uniref:Regulatory signaling modulator protein AmpE n=1 Tax=Neiella holothuriorum TaxID=2870530 RepID=A0ABS7EBC3_9GAMM|nr:regulatory signaling modulator protein AmpE [Neiella holothuriorum]MBW8189555.1 regulatory signaling modulator protein AmpE [Neiella holothuriorum]
MTLLALLIALAVERILMPSSRWQFVTYANLFLARISAYSQTKDWFNTPLGVVAISAIPTVLIMILLRLVEGMLFGLMSLVVTVLAITLAIGCLHARKAYKTFLRAARRGDEQACYMVAKELGALANDAPLKTEGSQDELPQDVELAVELLDEDEQLEQPKTPHCELEQGVGQTLAWINYRYYIAVMIWLVVFGAAGVVFYATIRTLADRELKNAVKPPQVNADDIDVDALELNENDEVAGLEEQVTDQAPSLTPAKAATELLYWFDFIPVRLASLGLTLVGNFSRAMPIWLEHLLNTKESPKAHLVRVSLAAEDIADPSNPTCVVSVTKFVEIAKRNVLLVLSVVAVLTLYGSVS